MSDHSTHPRHAHVHGPGCGHPAIRHNGHIDYAHDGHLHTPHGDHVDECKIAVDATNPSACVGGHACPVHADGHAHAPGCGHPAIPHGDHVDYLVGDHLHHQHGDHCDDHGPLVAACQWSWRVVQVGRVVVGVARAVVAVRVRVLADERRIVACGVVAVVVAVHVVVLDRLVDVRVAVALGDVQVHAEREQRRGGDRDQPAARSPSDHASAAPMNGASANTEPVRPAPIARCASR